MWLLEIRIVTVSGKQERDAVYLKGESPSDFSSIIESFQTNGMLCKDEQWEFIITNEKIAEKE